MLENRMVVDAEWDEVEYRVPRRRYKAEHEAYEQEEYYDDRYDRKYDDTKC